MESLYEALAPLAIFGGAVLISVSIFLLFEKQSR